MNKKGVSSLGYNTFPPQPFPPNSVGDKVEIDQLKEELEEVQEDISDINTDIGNLNTTKANQITIAPTFNAEDEYAVGNIIYYNGLTYRCVNAHTGEWDANDFIPTTIALELESKETIDYSETEQNTGVKWIDGKDIYCKVITVDSNIGTSNLIPHNITNLGEVIKAFGMMYLSGGNSFIPLSYISVGASSTLYGSYSAGLSDITSTTISVNIGEVMQGLVSRIRIILYYTKSTT